jgi:hypothetical protein
MSASDNIERCGNGSGGYLECCCDEKSWSWAVQNEVWLDMRRDVFLHWGIGASATLPTSEPCCLLPLL